MFHFGILIDSDIRVPWAVSLKLVIYSKYRNYCIHIKNCLTEVGVFWWRLLFWFPPFIWGFSLLSSEQGQITFFPCLRSPMRKCQIYSHGGPSHSHSGLVFQAADQFPCPWFSAGYGAFWGRCGPGDQLSQEMWEEAFGRRFPQK